MGNVLAASGAAQTINVADIRKDFQFVSPAGGRQSGRLFTSMLCTAEATPGGGGLFYSTSMLPEDAFDTDSYRQSQTLKQKYGTQPRAVRIVAKCFRITDTSQLPVVNRHIETLKTFEDRFVNAFANNGGRRVGRNAEGGGQGGPREATGLNNTNNSGARRHAGTVRGTPPPQLTSPRRDPSSGPPSAAAGVGVAGASSGNATTDAQLSMQQRHPLPNNCLVYEGYMAAGVCSLVRRVVHMSLVERLETRPFLLHTERLFHSYQILQAVEQLHGRYGCYHGDIKAENILVSDGGWVYLVDMAPFKPTYLSASQPTDFEFYFDNAEKRHCYLAPERFYDGDEPPAIARGGTGESSSTTAAGTTADGSPIESKSTAVYPPVTKDMDLFSAGAVIAFLLSERPLFKYSDLLGYRNKVVAQPATDKERRQNAEVLEELLSTKEVPAVARPLLSRLLSPEPSTRLTVTGDAAFMKQVFPPYFPYLFNYVVPALEALAPDLRVVYLARHIDAVIATVKRAVVDEEFASKLAAVLDTAPPTNSQQQPCHPTTIDMSDEWDGNGFGDDPSAAQAVADAVPIIFAPVVVGLRSCRTVDAQIRGLSLCCKMARLCNGGSAYILGSLIPYALHFCRGSRVGTVKGSSPAAAGTRVLSPSGSMVEGMQNSFQSQFTDASRQATTNMAASTGTANHSSGGDLGSPLTGVLEYYPAVVVAASLRAVADIAWELRGLDFPISEGHMFEEYVLPVVISVAQRRATPLELDACAAALSKIVVVATEFLDRRQVAKSAHHYEHQVHALVGPVLDVFLGLLTHSDSSVLRSALTHIDAIYTSVGKERAAERIFPALVPLMSLDGLAHLAYKQIFQCAAFAGVYINDISHPVIVCCEDVLTDPTKPEAITQCLTGVRDVLLNCRFEESVAVRLFLNVAAVLQHTDHFVQQSALDVISLAPTLLDETVIVGQIAPLVADTTRYPIQPLADGRSSQPHAKTTNARIDPESPLASTLDFVGKTANTEIAAVTTLPDVLSLHDGAPTTAGRMDRGCLRGPRPGSRLANLSVTGSGSGNSAHQLVVTSMGHRSATKEIPVAPSNVKRVADVPGQVFGVVDLPNAAALVAGASATTAAGTELQDSTANNNAAVDGTAASPNVPAGSRLPNEPGGRSTLDLRRFPASRRQMKRFTQRGFQRIEEHLPEDTLRDSLAAMRTQSQTMMIPVASSASLTSASRFALGPMPPTPASTTTSRATTAAGSSTTNSFGAVNQQRAFSLVGDVVCKSNDHRGPIYASAFHDGWLVTGGQEGFMRMWDVDDALQSAFLMSSPVTTGFAAGVPVRALGFLATDHSNSLIGVGSADGLFHVVDVEVESNTYTLSLNHEHNIVSHTPPISPPGQTPSTVPLWTPQQSSFQGIGALRYIPQSTLVLLGTDRGVVSCVDLRVKKEVFTHRMAENSGPVTAIALSASAARNEPHAFVCGTLKGSIHVFDVRFQLEVSRFSLPSETGASHSRQSSPAVACLDVAPYLAPSSSSAAITSRNSTKGHFSSSTTSPLALAGSSDGGVHIYELGAGLEVGSLVPHHCAKGSTARPPSTRCLLHVPFTTQVITGDSNGTIKSWNFVDAQQSFTPALPPFDGHTSTKYASAAFKYIGESRETTDRLAATPSNDLESTRSTATSSGTTETVKRHVVMEHVVHDSGHDIKHHEDAVTSLCLVHGAKGRQSHLVSTGREGVVKLWRQKPAALSSGKQKR